MNGFTESTIEKATIDWLKDMGCQRIAFGETDERILVSLRDSLLLKLMRGEVCVKDAKEDVT